MNWAKAKDILILVLALTCLMLGIILVSDEVKAGRQDKLSAQTAVEYMKSEGASSICDMPLSRPKLPVLFIKYEEQSTGALEKYQDYKVCKSGGDNIYPVLISVGGQKAKIIPASSAMLSIMSQVDSIKNLSVDSVELVYHVDAGGATKGSQDTAMPAWKFSTNKGEFFINAYGQ